MGRRRKVEGLIIDLTREPGDEVVSVQCSPPPVSIKKTECDICGISYNCRWSIGSSAVCFLCFRLSHATPDVAMLLRDVYNKPCEFCGDAGRIKHMDHKNMFAKNYNILDMIELPIEHVVEEVAKCQLLCLSCHNKVTHAERRRGFIKKKIHLNKLQRKGIDVSTLYQKYAQEYEAVMGKIYNNIKSGVYSGIIINLDD